MTDEACLSGTGAIVTTKAAVNHTVTKTRQFRCELAKNLRPVAIFLWFFDRPLLNHHIRTRVSLFLPCDWRFLPKLGPLHLRMRGPFLFTG